MSNHMDLQDRIAQLEKDNAELRRRLAAQELLNQELEQSHRASSSQLRLLLDNIPLGVVLIGPDLRVLAANQYMANVCGTTVEALVGHPCHQLFAKRAAPCPECPGLIAMETGSPCERVIQVPRDGNATGSVRIKALPALEGGQLTGFLEIAEDISEQEQIEHEKMLLAELVDNTDNIAVVKDTLLRYASVNRAFLKLIGGLERSAVLGRTDAELFAGVSTPEQIAQYMANDQQALALPHGEILTTEEQTLGDDGATRTFLSKKFPVYDAYGRCTGVATLATEITQRKRMEEELRRVNRQLHAFFENIPGHINLVDKSFTIVGVSRGLLNAYGLQDSDQVLGRKCYKALHGRKSVCPHCSLPRAFAEDRTVVRYSTPEEEERTGRASKLYAAPIKDEEGRIIGGMEFVADITDLRTLERQLIRAKDSAEAASKAKSLFLANMSHELRTPLNGVLGMLHLLQDSPLDPEQLEWAKIASGVGRNLLKLINDILDISKIEAGKMELFAAAFDPRELIRQVLETFFFQAREKGLPLHLEVAPDLPEEVVGDAGRLRQILFNLVGNAVKFTKEGFVRVQVCPLPYRPADGGLILLCSVQDTGLGIADADIEHIFQPFTQKDASSTRRYQGTGLGLAIVRNLVAMMQGQLCLASDPGQGTSIYFTVRVQLPSELATGVPAVAARECAMEALAPEPPEPEGGLHVLLAEDNRVNQMVFIRLLQRLGHRVTAVGTGREALAALAREPFDAVFMDIQMPDLDGLETTRLIRENHDGSLPAAIPIVALTAHGMKGDQDLFRKAGMNGYLAKPIDLQVLQELLHRLTAPA